MSEQQSEDIKTQLALRLCTAFRSRCRARTNNVPRPTVYRWAREPEVRKEVEACRRQIIDRAVGRLTGKFGRAVDRILKLADEAESESVQLRAARSILSEMIAVSKYSGLEGRMLEVEEQLREHRAGHAYRQS